MDNFNPAIFNSSLPAEFYSKFIDRENIADSWFLIKTPFPVLGILSLYLWVILKAGPQFMESRRPYSLKTVMRVYNLCQVIANTRLILYPLVYYATSMPFILQLSCRMPDASENNAHFDELKYQFLLLLHGYLVLKIVDLLDTVFMVLRKKYSHITFLHVYHHVTMVFCSWLTIKYIKSQQSILPGIINVFVHIVMYSYYFLATFGDPIKKYLWWKKYLTILQLGQFAVDIVYLYVLYSYDCPISKLFTYMWLFNAMMFFFLFLNFYIRTYVLKPSQEAKEKSS